MESLSLRFSPLSCIPFPSKTPRPNKKSNLFGHSKMIVTRTTRISCSSFDSLESSNFRHLLVDENMIVLRKRIHEMRMVERNYEPPSDWMEWERKYYTSYDEFICKFVGFIQTQLMNSRPSLALGMMVLVGLSVPVSTAMVALRLAELAYGVFSAIHG